MKNTKTILTSLIMMAVLSVSATHVNESTSPESTAVLSSSVSNAQIATYLQNCSHNHIVNWVQNIPGSSNRIAGIGGCSIATVYVVEGIVVSHADSNISCE